MKEYRLLSLNMRTDSFAILPGSSFRYRAKAVCQLVDEYEPDLIGVQELTERMPAQLGDLSERYTFYGSGRYGNRSASDERCCILFRKDRFRFVSGQTFWLSETPDQPGSKFTGSMFPRIATYAVLEDIENGLTFTMCNTHMDVLFPFIREKQCAVLKDVLHRKREGSFLVLTGDFNAPLSSRAMQEICGGENILKLKDALPAEAGTTIRSLIQAAASRYRPIDHMFLSKELEVDEAKIIRALFMGTYPSDHYPVFARFRLPKKIL
ncbi:MAG: endonuclease/exonuclease/phosphatase family protein [Solobacterium sp.]|nr:endonuclease/exonuclease/phosphatase family protein [Solobacterium sp.]MBQ9152974.1 endonuclease/exonuclease/phosphatase family protein [Solobacterium sp.]